VHLSPSVATVHAGIVYTATSSQRICHIVAINCTDTDIQTQLTTTKKHYQKKRKTMPRQHNVNANLRNASLQHIPNACTPNTSSAN